MINVKMQKRLLKILLLILAAAALFCLSGCEKDEKTESTSAVAEPVQTKKPQNEEKLMLLDVSGKFVSRFKEEYPEAELSFLIENLDTEECVTYNDKQMRCASLIKLFIMEHVYKEAAAGRYELTADRQKDLATMITESDNSAANRFIDDFGGVGKDRKIDESNSINQNIKKSGYKYTELNHKMYDKMPPEGPTKYQNYSSVSDIASLLRGLYNETLLEGDYNKEALGLMRGQKRRWKIPLRITEKYIDLSVANKTGELSQVENDAAIIEGEDFNLIFVIMTDKIPKMKNGDTNYELKEKVQNTIGDFALEIVEAYMKKAKK